jgi:hypothetical protein
VSVARYVLVAMAFVLLGAEIARPTAFAPKRVSPASLARAGARASLDRTELDDLPPIDAPALGNLDAAVAVVGGSPVPLATGTVLPPDASLRMVGWCADPLARVPGALLLAIVDGRRLDVSASYRLRRDDVARTLGAPTLRDVGFAFDLPARALGPGVHAVRFAVVTADLRALSLFPALVRVQVSPASARDRGSG